jgi:hypothetical protein
MGRRQLKTVDELSGWIVEHATQLSRATRGGGAAPFTIIRMCPGMGRSDWKAVDASVPRAKPRSRWSTALRYSISQAQLLFDLR